MRRAYIRSVVALAAFLAGALFCFREWRELRKLKAQLKNYAAAPAPVRDSGAKPLRAEIRSATQNSSDEIKKLISEAPKGPGGIPLVVPESLFGLSPTLKESYTRAARSFRLLRYGPFLAASKLEEDKKAELIDILGTREEKWADIQAKATLEGKSTTDPEVALAIRTNNEAADAAIQKLLGASFESYKSFSETMDARYGLISLKALIVTSYRTSEPIIPQQMDYLATLVTQGGAMTRSSDALGVVPPFDKFGKAAEQILAPSSVEVFDLLLDHHQITSAALRLSLERSNKH